MKVLQLSETTLSGSPIRLSKLLNKYSKKVESRHLVWQSRLRDRVFDTDLVGPEISKEEVQSWLDWSDVICYHNRRSKLTIFKELGLEIPKKPSMFQIHSPRQSEDFSEVTSSKLPIAVIGQYHPREWPELKFIVPNCVDIWAFDHQPIHPFLKVSHKNRNIPIVSFAPSNTTAKGWDNKGYGLVAGILKPMKLAGRVHFQLIIKKPHAETLELKKQADLGIDEVMSGSYHMSSLEYLSMAVACMANIDAKTEKVVKDMTGCENLPWILATSKNFGAVLRNTLNSKSYIEQGIKSREWMEKFWSPEFLCKKYEEVYSQL